MPPKEEDQLKKAAAQRCLLADGPAARNETWNKLNADPLLMMRMQEQDARKHVTENPVKMAQIRREVAESDSRRRRKTSQEGGQEGGQEGQEEAIRDEIRRKILGEEDTQRPNKKRKTSRRSKVMTTTLHHLRLEALSATAEDAAGRGQGRGPGAQNAQEDSDGRDTRNEGAPFRKRGRSRSHSRGRDRDNDRVRGVG